MMAETSTLLSWLHLSDIHFGHGDRSYILDQASMLQALERDIALLVKERRVPPPELLFLTGDVAFSAGERNHVVDEYGAAAAFLTRIIGSLRIDPSNVFSVPGNHDVRRASASSPEELLLAEIREGGQLPENVAPARTAELSARLDRYLAFVSNAPIAQECGASHWTAGRKSASGLKFRVFGLNSAWLSNDNRDFGRLRFAPGSLAAFSGGLDKSLRFLLTHHPFGLGWMAEEAITADRVRDAHVHLCGHVHEHGSQMHGRHNLTSTISIVAGAVHMDKAAVPPDAGVRVRDAIVGHGYSFGSVCMASGQPHTLHVRIYPRRWSRRNNSYRWDVDELPDNLSFASYALQGIDLAGATPPPQPEAYGEVVDLGGGDQGGAAVRRLVQESRRRVWHASLSDEINWRPEQLDAFSALRRQLVSERAENDWEYHYIANLADARRKDEIAHLLRIRNLRFRAWTFCRAKENGLSLNFFVIDDNKTVLATKVEPHGVRFFLVVSEPFSRLMAQVFLQESDRAQKCSSDE